MKKVLFIDYQIPHYDQSAGDKTSYLYLNIFLEIGASVTFIPSNFKKVYPYSKEIKNLGVKVLDGKFFRYFWRLWLMLFSYKFDYAFLNKPKPTKRFIDYVRRFSRAKIIYQCHDLHYLRQRRKYYVDGEKGSLDLSFETERLEIELIKKSDILLTFSEHEKEIIVDRIPHQRVEVVPLYFYDNIEVPSVSFSDRQGILFVGGFKHSPNVDAMLWFAKEVYPIIKNKCSNIKVYVVGSHPNDEITNLNTENVDINILGHVSDEKLAELYRTVRLAIIPLRYGAGVKGKTIEAISHSLPIVSTSIGIEGICLDGIIQATDSSEEFADKVIFFHENETENQLCSLELHKYALKKLTNRTARESLVRVISELDFA